MTKQILEIEVPEGKKAVWKDGKVIFEDENPMRFIKTAEDAINYLRGLNICLDILDTLSKLPAWSFEYKVASYRAVVAALTYNEKRHLTVGERWFPTVEFCCPGMLKNCYGDTILGRIKSEGREFDVVGGYAYYSASSGLGFFSSYHGVGYVSALVGFQSVGSKETALYISKQFGRLLFEISYGGVNCNWEWID